MPEINPPVVSGIKSKRKGMEGKFVVVSPKPISKDHPIDCITEIIDIDHFRDFLSKAHCSYANKKFDITKNNLDMAMSFLDRATEKIAEKDKVQQYKSNLKVLIKSIEPETHKYLSRISTIIEKMRNDSLSLLLDNYERCKAKKSTF